MALIVANYTSLSHQKYKISIEDKVKACTAALKQIEDLFPVGKKEEVIPESGGPEKFEWIYKFHKIYLFRMIRHLPPVHINKEIMSSAITLYLLGYPFHLDKCMFYIYMVFMNELDLLVI